MDHASLAWLLLLCWQIALTTAVFRCIRLWRSSIETENKILAALMLLLGAIVGLFFVVFYFHPQNQTSTIAQMPLLTVQECELVTKHAEEHAKAHGGWQKKRHRNYPTTDLPLYDVKALSAWWNNTVQPRLETAMRKLLDVHDSDVFVMRDLFVVKYTSEGQRGLELHSDGSHLSYNVLLSPSDDFEGGGTYFRGPAQEIHPPQGSVLLHESHTMHQGLNVTTGQRFILVGFVWVSPASSSWWRMFGTLTHCFNMVHASETFEIASEENICVSRLNVIGFTLHKLVTDVIAVAPNSRLITSLLVLLALLVTSAFGLLAYGCYLSHAESPSVVRSVRKVE